MFEKHNSTIKPEFCHDSRRIVMIFSSHRFCSSCYNFCDGAFVGCDRTTAAHPRLVLVIGQKRRSGHRCFRVSAQKVSKSMMDMMLSLVGQRYHSIPRGPKTAPFVVVAVLVINGTGSEVVAHSKGTRLRKCPLCTGREIPMGTTEETMAFLTEENVPGIDRRICCL
jgi:hypothetical protein